MRVCFFGTYRANYARNQILIEGLRLNGVEVVECHESLWAGTNDRLQVAKEGWLQPRFWWRLILVYKNLLKKYLRMGPYDVLVVLYPGALDVFLARWLSWLRRKPLVWDILLPLYLILVDRGLLRQRRLRVRVIRWIEKTASRLPDLVLFQTRQCASWFQEVYGFLPKMWGLIPVGADDRFFFPTPYGNRKDGLFRVLFYGTFIPNHGLDYVIEAAFLLKDDKTIFFEIIGTGPERDKITSMAQHYHLTNVAFHDWLDKEALIRKASGADLLLGIFGLTPQSELTLHNKVFEGLALGKPVLTGDSPAIREVMEHGKHLYLCERGNPKAIALAIRELQTDKDLRSRLAQQGRDYYKNHYNIENIGRLFTDHLLELLVKGTP